MMKNMHAHHSFNQKKINISIACLWIPFPMKYIVMIDAPLVTFAIAVVLRPSQWRQANRRNSLWKVRVNALKKKSYPDMF